MATRKAAIKFASKIKPLAKDPGNGFPKRGKRKVFDTGLAIRKHVLGDAYVDNAIAGADDFSRPMQQLVTEYCWGEIWGSDALDLRTRSMLNLAMLTALGKKDEIKLHTRGAVTNGVTVAEIQAVMLQTCIYCGVPAALDGMKAVKETLKEMGEI